MTPEKPRHDGEELDRMVQIDKLIADLQSIKDRFGNTCCYIRRGGLSWGAVALNRRDDDEKHGVFDLQAQHDRDMTARAEQVKRLIEDRNEWRDRAWKAEVASPATAALGTQEGVEQMLRELAVYYDDRPCVDEQKQKPAEHEISRIECLELSLDLLKAANTVASQARTIEALRAALEQVKRQGYFVPCSGGDDSWINGVSDAQNAASEIAARALSPTPNQEKPE